MIITMFSLLWKYGIAAFAYLLCFQFILIQFTFNGSQVAIIRLQISLLQAKSADPCKVRVNPAKRCRMLFFVILTRRKLSKLNHGLASL